MGEHIAVAARLLADELEELLKEEPRGDVRTLGWHRPGLGESPLTAIRRREASPSMKPSWTDLSLRLQDAVRFGAEPPVADADDVTRGPQLATQAMEERIDKLLQEDDQVDEAIWLNVAEDATQLKNQVVSMIMEELIVELAGTI